MSDERDDDPIDLDDMEPGARRTDDRYEDEQTVSMLPSRLPNGQFGPGNNEGRRFGPGNPGGPGRPPSINRELFEVLEQEIAVKEGDRVQVRKIKQVIAMALARKAMTGDVYAIRTIVDRTDGKVPLPLRIGPEQEQESQTDLVVTVVPSKAYDVPAAQPGATAAPGGNGDAKGNGKAGNGKGRELP